MRKKKLPILGRACVTPILITFFSFPYRDRFRTIHGELRKIYDSMQYIQFLRSLVQIPRLSEDISYFFETLSKMSDRSLSIEEQEVTEFPIQTFEEDLVSVTTDGNYSMITYVTVV